MTEDGPIPLDAFRRILRETPEEDKAADDRLEPEIRQILDAAVRRGISTSVIEDTTRQFVDFIRRAKTETAADTEEEALTREWERAMEGADPPTAAEQFRAYDEAMAEAVEITPAVERLIRRIVRDEIRRMRRR